MGMQACNLQNLPENYTMKYCERNSLPTDVLTVLTSPRFVPSPHLAISVICRRGPQGPYRRLYPCENVCAAVKTVSFVNLLPDVFRLGKRSLRPLTTRMGTSHPSQSSDHIGD